MNKFFIITNKKRDRELSVTRNPEKQTLLLRVLSAGPSIPDRRFLKENPSLRCSFRGIISEFPSGDGQNL